MVAFPVDTFLPGSDLSAIQARKREFYDGLTTWRSAANFTASDATPLLKVTGASYEAALQSANHLLLANMWGDGLPAWPATRALVDWILQAPTCRATKCSEKSCRAAASPPSSPAPSRSPWRVDGRNISRF